MYAAPPADERSQMKRSERLTHLYATHLPHDCKQEAGEQYAPLYPAHGDTRGGGVVVSGGGGGECGGYPPCHGGQRSDMQGDMLSSYAREHTEALLIGGRGLSGYGAEKDTGMPSFCSAAERDGGGMPGFCAEDSRGMPGFCTEKDSRGMPGFCAEKDSRGMPGFCTEKDSRGMPGFCTEKDSRGMPGFCTEKDRGMPGFCTEKDRGMPGFCAEKDRGMPGFCSEKDRGGMPGYFAESESRMAGYCAETDRRVSGFGAETDRRVGGFGADTEARDGQGGRGLSDPYSSDRERGAAGYTPESMDSNPPLDDGRETDGGGSGGGSGSEREVSTQGTPASRKVPHIQCLKCKEKIKERHMVLLNDGRFLHERCLRCEVCLLTVHLTDDRGSVLLRDNKVYCRKDYMQLFSAEGRREMPCCIKCNVQLEKDNWVRRADNYLFHMTCFCCSKCSRQLSKWEQFVMREDRLICEKHFYENDGSQKGDSPKPRAKRMRTSFTEEQVKVLQQHFAIDSNPDGQDLERIAKLTGLKKRVTQVWFQNNRARHKKSLQQKSGAGGGTTSLPSSFSPSMPASAMYVSASEDGDSIHGNDFSSYSADVDHPDDGSGHGDFAPQTFWSHMDN